MGAPERTAQRIAMLSLAVSAALATVKISVGLAAHSVAVVSDGVESAGDCLASGLVLLGLWAYTFPKIGVEFMPPLNEGTVMDMPVTVPRIGLAQAGDDLKARDALLRSFPEVESVIGKAGRADTATDPAPLEMFETTIQFKPRSEWRAGMNPDKIVEELDRVVMVFGKFQKRMGPRGNDPTAEFEGLADRPR